MVVYEKVIMLTVEEKKFVRELVLKLNNNIFCEDLFTFDVLDDRDFMKLVFVLRSYEYVKNNKLWRATDKERVRKYMNKQNRTVSRKDVCLLSFFKQLGVL